MLRYLLILLLINTYGRSLGTPVPSPGSNGKILIANLLSDLMTECKNKFARGQIANNLKECNVTAPPFHEIEMQCLVFLDASNLLCNISNASLPNLAADFVNKTSGKIAADEFCAEAAHFSLLPTPFKTLISKVFQGDALCNKICMDKDVLSGDTHFVCKYYKWSMGLFQTPASTGLHNSTVRNGVSVPGAETEEGKPIETVTTNANNTSRVQVGDPETNVSETSLINVQNSAHVETTTKGLTTSLNQFTTNDSTTVNTNLPEGNDRKPKLPQQTGHDGPNVDGEGNAEPGFNHDNSPIAINGQDVIDHPPDAGAGYVGDGEREDDSNAEDDVDGMEPDMDVRNSQHLAPHPHLNPIAESSQRDSMPNISEGFTEDDDHFFPFFLTAVIIVIIIYVLYHNKSKVGKMFFGLIVEGRQSGRRRNSRGHSYRRLDTLEQAMSASAPAPPSKIIY